MQQRPPPSIAQHLQDYRLRSIPRLIQVNQQRPFHAFKSNLEPHTYFILDVTIKGYYNSYVALCKGGTMRVTNTVELKNKTNEILREVMKGSPVIITFRGKPAASLTPLKEDDLEDFILENSPTIQKMIAQAEKDIQAGKVVSLKEYLAKLND